MAKRNSVAEALMNYMTENADRVIIVTEVTETLGLNRTSVFNGMRRLTEKFPEHLEKRGTSWIWHSTSRVVKPAGQLDEDLVLLKVLRKKEDGSLLALDEATDDLYICKRVEF